MTDRFSPMPTRGAVIAGFDGSDAAWAAARFAAIEARSRDVPLELLHAFTWPWIYPPFIPDPDISEPNPRVGASRQIRASADKLRAECPGLRVHGRVLDGPAAAVLAEWSRRGDVLVVGHRGAGGFRGLLAGSVAIHTAAHAYCPVLVVRGEPVPDGPVVVGVDGSPDAYAATTFAFAAAARHEVPLVAVTVWPDERIWPESMAAHGYPPPSIPDLLAAGMAECGANFPGVKVRTEVTRAHSPAGALVDAATGASMVVVGSRGLNALEGLLLGSVGRALIEHAPCPVAIVRPVES